MKNAGVETSSLIRRGGICAAFSILSSSTPAFSATPVADLLLLVFGELYVAR